MKKAKSFLKLSAMALALCLFVWSFAFASVTIPYKEGYDPYKEALAKASTEEEVRETIDEALALITSASDLVEQGKAIVNMLQNGTDTCPTVTLDPPRGPDQHHYDQKKSPRS